MSEDGCSTSLPDIPRLRQVDRRVALSPDRTSTGASLALIPILLGLIGSGALVGVLRWSGAFSAPAPRATLSSAARPADVEPAPAARPATATPEDAILTAPLQPDPAPSAASSAAEEVPPSLRPWSDRLSREMYAALGVDSAPAASPEGERDSAAPDDSVGADDAPRGSGAGAETGLGDESAGSQGQAAAIPASARHATTGPSGSERPRLALHPDSQAFRLRAHAESPDRTQEARKGAPGAKGKDIDLASYAESVRAAKEASANAVAQAGAFRRAVEQINVDFQGPWQQDPVLLELHDAVSRARRAGLDAAGRLESHGALLMNQATSLQADLAQAQTFAANPFATTAPTLTAQRAPQPPDISSQMAEMRNAVDTIQRLKRQLPPGM